ncbi:MAG: hypothetical protein KA369_03980 [Spirochaetes bacterium]|nr:hypothetical protein [Spirochaetota bacterium]
MRAGSACAGFLLCALLAALQNPAFPAKKQVTRTMDFHEFAKQVRGKESFALKVRGAPRESFFTGKRYVHYETVAYIGVDDIRSTHQMLYHTDEDFTVIFGSAAVPVRYSQVRTCLNPSFERKYAKEDLVDPRSAKEKSLRSIMDDKQVTALLLVEYGLGEGITYYGRLKTEGYHLPPQEPGGRPERREKTVLLISDRSFPNECELTPLYQGWSY